MSLGPQKYAESALARSNGDGTFTPLVELGGNISTKVRDAGEFYPNPEAWEEVAIGADDFIVARGGPGGSGWIEISKSPIGVDDETILRLVDPVTMPARISLMTSMTHRNAGQQLASFEFVSDDAAAGLEPLPVPEPVAILDASQSGSTITVNLASAPAEPYKVGQVVSIYGFTDTRLNVNSATIASVPSPLQVTVVGNDYTPTGTTIATTLGNGDAFIERYDLLGRARNGLAIVQGNSSATNRRFYVRSQGGLARPSGTLAGTHNITTGTDVASAAATGYDQASWIPPLEMLVDVSRNGVLFADRAPDSNGTFTQRHALSQVVPNPKRSYRSQFRVRAVPSMTRPLAKIVSISKSGSTTATIVTDGDHGIEVGQYIGHYGVRDQANFANQTTGAIVVSTPTTDSLTVVTGASATTTSYGGFVMRVQGQQPLGGAIAQVAQSVARTGDIVTLVGHANWAAPTTNGNIVELFGVRDAVTGADLNVDGSYEIINIATNTLTLRVVVDGYGVARAPIGPDLVTTNCGGGVIQRLGYRIHSAMVIGYEPLLTEPAAKGNSASGESVGNQLVTVQGTATVSLASTTLSGGQAAHDAAVSGNPLRVAARAVTANYAAVASNDTADLVCTVAGAQVVKPYSIPELEWSFTSLLTTTSDVVVQAAAGAGLKRHTTWFQATNQGAAAVDVLLRDGTTTRLQITVPAGQSIDFPLPTGMNVTANTALNAALSAAGTVRLNLLGYTGP